MSSYRSPWGKALTLMSIFTTFMLVGLPLIALFVFSLAVGAVIAFVGGLLFVAVALLFMVRGYSIKSKTLHIHRPFWDNEYDLSELESAKLGSDEDFRRATRVMGNGGAFSFTGYFRSKALGSFRSYANDIKGTVVLKFKDQTIVLNPDRPYEFVEELEMLK